MTNEQLNLAETVTEFIRSRDWLNTRDIRTLAQFRDAAVCVDSPIGEYRCQVEILFSPQSGRKPICVDTCLQHEIHELIFKHNVNTIGCCCGHGRKQAYIQVSPQSVQKMHELGYEPLPESEDGQGKWCFKPKTFFLEPVNRTYKFSENDLVNRFVPPDWKLFENLPPNYCGAENTVPAEDSKLSATIKCGDTVTCTVAYSEEVYNKYVDTAGNLRWTGTHSGEHVIPAEEGE